ncbi:alpha-amylase family glycosyl hydrolase [Actinacidiphila glaucinigra]|uniref:carbohydrate binding domain-containing protein n=1 Tax=Actinacidiphila glaucinigra TaxID=235986 RepID=UPI00324EE017
MTPPACSGRHRALRTVLLLVGGLLLGLLPTGLSFAATSATVYYRPASAWSTVNLHYAPTGGAWTTVPGVAMEAACAGWYSRTVDLGGAGGLSAAFTDGSGAWDNNGGGNYRLTEGVSTVRNRVVTRDADDPCAVSEPDTTAPTAPTGLTAKATGTSVVVSWTAATDDTAVTGYEVTRTGGTKGTSIAHVGSTVTSQTGLEERTAYTYTVKALDAAGNVSAASAPAAVTTGEAPRTTPGEPLGGDPRKDPIYFVLTARFHDGDASNNRGGSQHVKSGNAAGGDPMFRGDFKGLVDKLDYVKGLGFSAIWITPVVLNRSDYDYHGYHGWDFYRVDPRLESAGASYQDLINAAHAKGIKVYQDVVSDNAFLNGNSYHTPDRSRFSGMNVIDMRMHMNFGSASNAFNNGKDSDDSTNDATYNVVYVDSHDYGPNKSSFRYAEGTDAWAENMSLMWTFRGIPTLYYGSEIEFQKGKQIDCGPSCPLASTGRAYYGTHLEGEVTASGFGSVSSASGQVATTLAQPLVKHVQRLNQIRRAVPALQTGQYSTAGVGGEMAFKRRFTDAATGVDSFALVTVSGGATFTGIPNGTYKDAVTGAVRTVTGGSLSVDAPGKGNLRVYVLDLGGGNAAPGKVGSDGPYLR